MGCPSCAISETTCPGGATASTEKRNAIAGQIIVRSHCRIIGFNNCSVYYDNYGNSTFNFLHVDMSDYSVLVALFFVKFLFVVSDV